MAAPAPAPAPAPAATPTPVTDLTWRELIARAEAGDVATVEHFVVEHDHNPELADMLVHYAARGGRTELVRLLVTKHRASAACAMHGAMDGIRATADRGPCLDIARFLCEPIAGEDPEDRDRRMCDGFLDSIHTHNQALVSLFFDHVSLAVFATGFNLAVATDSLAMVHLVFRHRRAAAVAELVSGGIQATGPDTSTDVVRYLIEKGATNWPAHVYTRLSRKPNLVKHFYKLGIPLALLTGGHAPIQAIVDAHLRWNAHVRETLDELGVYKVLADLIVQY